LDKIKGDNIYRIYPAEIFCDNQIKDKCIINNSEHLFYRDSVHLSPVGAKYLADKIFSKIKEIEKQNK
jgi:lysophospholipase L1-like esterase